MTGVSKLGGVPVYQQGINDDLFVKEPAALFEYMMYDDGSGRHVPTGFIVPGKKFDIWGLCMQDAENAPRTILIDAIAYRDTDGEVKTYSREHQPIAVDRRNWQFGFVSKLAGLRWGFTLHIEPESGVAYIHVDLGSPILGIKFHFE